MEHYCKPILGLNLLLSLLLNLETRNIQEVSLFHCTSPVGEKLIHFVSLFSERGESKKKELLPIMTTFRFNSKTNFKLKRFQSETIYVTKYIIISPHFFNKVKRFQESYV